VGGFLLDEVFSQESRLKEIAREIIMSPVDEVITLPDQVRRLKNLFEGLTIAIGVLVDYPLGCGTTAKLAFEINQARKDGARQFYVPFPLNLVKTKSNALRTWIQELEKLVYDPRDIYFLLNTHQLKEVEKLELSKKIQDLQLRKLALMAQSEQAILHDLTIFRFDNDYLADVKLLIQSTESICNETDENYFVRVEEREGFNAK
jgi:hypothetical protein